MYYDYVCIHLYNITDPTGNPDLCSMLHGDYNTSLLVRGYKIHGSSHTPHQLVRDHPVSQVSIPGHLTLINIAT